MTSPKRNIELRFSPVVTHSAYNGVIYVETGSWSGNTRYACKGELTMNCAAHLIVELRKAMRAIRKERVSQMDTAIAKAEGNVDG